MEAPVPARPRIEPARPRFPWAVALIAATVVALGCLALVAYLRTLSEARQVADGGVDLVRYVVTNAPSIAERFQTGTITHTFRKGIPEVSRNQGDILELATSRSEETITRRDARRVAWDRLYLGTTLAEIRVPVTFRYHVRLSDPWKLAVRDQVCVVLAPPIRPSLPPAIHTEGMEKRAESGWARFDKGDQLDALERDLTATLSERAADPAHLALVREACRQSVAGYVRNWLLKEEHWREDRFTAVKVYFPDELAVESDEELARYGESPTLLLGGP